MLAVINALFQVPWIRNMSVREKKYINFMELSFSVWEKADVRVRSCGRKKILKD